MTFNYYNPGPVHLDSSGLHPCNGGSLTFCELGTTTPKGTWADQAQTIPNENPVPLDSAGRSDTDIWLDGGYTVTLRDGNGVVVWTHDVDSGQGDSASIPPTEGGKFLTSDGSNLLWQAVREVPDPSGSADYMLTTDGSNLLWKPQPVIPEPPEPDWVVGDKSLTLSGMTIQAGIATIPASSNYISSVGVTFTTAFTELYAVVPAAGIVSVGSFGAGVTLSVTGYSPGTAATNVTINANCTDDGGDGRAIASPVPVTWIAFGKVATP